MTQATLHGCEFCGESSVEELELTPAVEETRGEGDARGRVTIKPAVMVWACTLHAERIRGGVGWQERQKDKSRRLTREAKERLKRDQLSFGDAG